jgi:Xaa-Pro aminopeptidase
LPTQPVYEHAAPYAVVPRSDKLARVRQAMASVGATHHLVSTVDDLAWLLNLRGSDVECNPVFIGHLLLDAQGGRLFIGDGKVPADLAHRLAADGIVLAPYADTAATLAALPMTAKLLIDPRRVTLGLREAAPAGLPIVEQINPSTLLKSRKTPQEAAFIREAMAEDGAAMCEFYAEFEASIARGEPWTELDVDTRLTAARRRRPGFVGLSFSTIAGWMANGALPHYRALPESFARIEGDGLLLIDSGGQYPGGTTDITRVWPIGQVNAAQKRDYTLVLKGTLALSRTRFPRGTLSPMLDAIARAPLWAHGLDYGHGTGHGVGYFLNVHEGPQSISKAIPEPSMAMEPGMITSIEPGLYRPGLWGVRIENLVLNVAVETPEKNAFGEMLEFETLTLCPIDTRCIDRSLLQADEVDWLNRYHATVRERLAPKVSGAALAWLIERTEPI